MTSIACDRHADSFSPLAHTLRSDTPSDCTQPWSAHRVLPTHGRSRRHRAPPHSHVADHPLIQCVSRCGPPLESAFRPVSDRPRPALQPPRLGLAWLTLRRPSPSTGTLQPPPRPPLSSRIGESAPPEPLLFRHLPLTDKVSVSPDGLRAGSEWPTGWLVSQPALVPSPTSRSRRPQTADFFSGAP